MKPGYHEIYSRYRDNITRGVLKPGEALEDIVLEKPLPAGSHQAIAVTTVYDKDGAPALTTRVPVTINVAE